jgi:hypothetical protein
MGKTVSNEIIEQECEKWARFLYQLYRKEKDKEKADKNYHSKILNIVLKNNES